MDAKENQPPSQNWTAFFVSIDFFTVHHLKAVLLVNPVCIAPIGYLGVHRAAGCRVMSYFVSKVG